MNPRFIIRLATVSLLMFIGLMFSRASMAASDSVTYTPNSGAPATPPECSAGTCRRAFNWSTDSSITSTPLMTGNAEIVWGQDPPSWFSEGSSGASGWWVDAATDGTAWAAAGIADAVYKRNAASMTWASQSTGSSGVFFYRTAAFNTTSAWASSTGGKVAMTTDGGTSWVFNNIATTQVVLQMYLTSPTTGWALTAEDMGAIGPWRSALWYWNGSSWTSKWSTGTETCYGLSTRGGTDFLVACNKGKMYRITNPLAATPTVQNFSTTITDDYLYTIDSFDRRIAYAGGVKQSSGYSALYRLDLTAGTVTPISGVTSWDISIIQSTDVDKFLFIERYIVKRFDNNSGTKVTTFPGIGGDIQSIDVPRNDLIMAMVYTGGTSMVYRMPKPFTGTTRSQTFSVSTSTPAVEISGLVPATTFYYAADSQIGSEKYGEFGAAFTTPTIDLTPPALTWTNPLSAGQYFRSCPLGVATSNALRGTASDNVSVQTVTVTFDGVGQPVTWGGPSAPSVPAPWSITNLSCLQLQSGRTHTLSATATDNSGNTDTKSTTIYYDDVRPTVAITSPHTDSTTTAPYVMSGNASDPVLVAGVDKVMRVYVTVNSGTPIDATLVPAGGAATVTWSVPLNSPDLVPGLNNVLAYAVDAAGNTSLSDSAQITYNVPTFDIAASAPTSKTINAGDSTTFPITITPRFGFTGTINLTYAGAIAGMTLSLPPSVTMSSPAPVTVNLTVNTVTTVATSPPNYTLTVTGTYAPTSIVKPTSVQLTIDPAPDFTFTVNPISNPLPFVAGGTTPFTLNVSGTANYQMGGTFGTPISFSYVSPLPGGVTASILPLSGDPSHSGSGTSTASFTVTSILTNAPVRLIAEDTVMGLSHDVTIYLTSTPPPDFDIDIQPASQPISPRLFVAGDPGPDGTTYFNVTVTAKGGFTGAVNLTTDTTPLDAGFEFNYGGSTMPFVPSSTGTVVTINVIAHSGVRCAPVDSPCTFKINVTGTAGALTKIATANMVVSADVVAPLVNAPMAAPDVNSVLVTWSTNEPADSLVTVYSDPAQDAAHYVNSGATSTFCLTTCHSITVGSLNDSTDYWYTISSVDQAYPTGNRTVRKTVNTDGSGGPLHFKTLAAPDVTPPSLIITVPANGSTVIGGVSIKATAGDDNVMQQVNLQITFQGDTSPTIDTSLACTPAGSTSCNVSYIWNTMGTPAFGDEVPNGTYIITMVAISTAGPPSPPASVTINVANDLNPPQLLCLSGQVVCEPEAIQTSLNCVGSPVRCSITIHWLTDRPSTTEIEYGLAVDDSGSRVRPDGTITSGSYTDFRSDPGLVTTHSITLTGLLQNQLYHYRITSCNVSNLCTN